MRNQHLIVCQACRWTIWSGLYTKRTLAYTFQWTMILHLLWLLHFQQSDIHLISYMLSPVYCRKMEGYTLWSQINHLYVSRLKGFLRGLTKAVFQFSLLKVRLARLFILMPILLKQCWFQNLSLPSRIPRLQWSDKYSSLQLQYRIQQPLSCNHQFKQDHWSTANTPISKALLAPSIPSANYNVIYHTSLSELQM